MTVEDLATIFFFEIKGNNKEQNNLKSVDEIEKKTNRVTNNLPLLMITEKSTARYTIFHKKHYAVYL